MLRAKHLLKSALSPPSLGTQAQVSRLPSCMKTLFGVHAQVSFWYHPVFDCLSISFSVSFSLFCSLFTFLVPLSIFYSSLFTFFNSLFIFFVPFSHFLVPFSHFSAPFSHVFVPFATFFLFPFAHFFVPWHFFLCWVRIDPVYIFFYPFTFFCPLTCFFRPSTHSHVILGWALVPGPNCPK